MSTSYPLTPPTIKIAIAGEVKYNALDKEPTLFKISEMTHKTALEFFQSGIVESVAVLSIQETRPNSTQNRVLFDYQGEAAEYDMTPNLALRIIDESQTAPNATILERAILAQDLIFIQFPLGQSSK